MPTWGRCTRSGRTVDHFPSLMKHSESVAYTRPEATHLKAEVGGSAEE